MIQQIRKLEDDAIIVDIGAKVEGRISKREFAFQKDQKNIVSGFLVSGFYDQIRGDLDRSFSEN